MNGPARFTLFVMEVGGGVLMLLFVVGGDDVAVTVMLGGDCKWRMEREKGIKLLLLLATLFDVRTSSSYFYDFALKLFNNFIEESFHVPVADIILSSRKIT